MEILKILRKTTSNKTFRDKAFNIAKKPKYDRYQRVITFMVHKCFYKTAAGGAVKNENLLNQDFAKELHKPIIKKLKNRKVNNILGAGQANIWLISKINRGATFLLCIADILSKCVY